ncbi:MAG: HlyD family efflux transporter periplasmic adaptor subunit [Methylococcaceae bacterium]|nr:HlyD family efflux transporter periplasmic adaptor subunit [Methylococcaceae bacterium]
MTEQPELFKQPPPAALARAETPPWARAMARWLALILLLLLVGLGFTPWQQNVRGIGRVVAYAPVERQQTIAAPVESRLLRWLVREGSKVQTGDVLAELSDNDPQLLQRLEAERETVLARRQAGETRLEAARRQLAMAETARPQALEAARARVAMAEQRRQAARHAVTAAEAAGHTARLNLDRQDRLQGKGLSSRRTLELAQLEMAQRETETERARASLRASDSELEALRADLRKLEADTASAVEKSRADLNKTLEEFNYLLADLLKLETRIARQRTQTVTAPRAGQILRLLANPGAELLKSGQALAILVPDAAERAVELWMDGNDVPLITPGRPVRLQFEGYPAVQFGGWPELAVGSFGGTVALIDATDDGRGKFRVLVTPDPDDQPWPGERFLRQGVRTHGWVLLARVSLGYELWRIFNGFPPIVLPEIPAPAKTDGYGAAKSDSAKDKDE